LKNSNKSVSQVAESELKRFLALLKYPALFIDIGPRGFRGKPDIVEACSAEEALAWLHNRNRNHRVFVYTRCVKATASEPALPVVLPAVELYPYRFYLVPPGEDAEEWAVLLHGRVYDACPVPGFYGAKLLRREVRRR